MKKNFYIETSFVMASIMRTKEKHYQESFVTLKEINVTKKILQSKFNEDELGIIITDNIDFKYFKSIDGVIYVKNDDVTLNHLIDRYLGCCYSNECLLILWDDNFIHEIIENIKMGNDYINHASLEGILNKILDNPTIFYKKIAQELSLEEYEFLKRKIENKSCLNCSNYCNEKNKNICFDWDNPTLVGKIKILKK